MKVNIKDLGKVSVTAEGLHSPSKPYERITIVHDGLYSSYISRKDVPTGIQLSNEEYWQPIASLKEEFRADLIVIRTEILNAIADVIKKLKNSRIVVANEADRNALTINEVAPGCEVYELDTERTYILDTIVADTNVKTWHIESDGLIDSEPKYELSGTYDELVADRARCDQFGNVIDQTYLTIAAVNEFIKKNVEKHLTNIGAVILPESIKPNDLSPAVLELIGYRNITNLPDEEDLTAVNKCNGTQVLKFKDKQYDIDSFSGDGTIHLRKQFYANVNVLDQCAINKPNTIYIIKYDFCLYGKTIIVPENVTLDFQGGHILNGTLILNKTKVKGIVGSVYDYLKCNIIGTFLDGQLSYENGKMCCWQTNAFVPICNCGTEPPPPVYEQRNIGVYGYNGTIGITKNVEVEDITTMSMISSYSPNDTFVCRAIVPEGYEFKGWFKAVYPNTVPAVGTIIEDAVFYSNNEIITITYNNLVDNQTVCFVAKYEEIIIKPRTAVFIGQNCEFYLRKNGGAQKSYEKYTDSVGVNDVVDVRYYQNDSAYGYDNWYKCELPASTTIIPPVEELLAMATKYTENKSIAITYNDLKDDINTFFIIKTYVDYFWFHAHGMTVYDGFTSVNDLDSSTGSLMSFNREDTINNISLPCMYNTNSNKFIGWYAADEVINRIPLNGREYNWENIVAYNPTLKLISKDRNLMVNKDIVTPVGPALDYKGEIILRVEQANYYNYKNILIYSPTQLQFEDSFDTESTHIITKGLLPVYADHNLVLKYSGVGTLRWYKGTARLDGIRFGETADKLKYGTSWLLVAETKELSIDYDNVNNNEIYYAELVQ